MRAVTRLLHTAALLAMTALPASLAFGPATAQERLDVVATTGMIADTARAIGGDLIDLRALLGPGVDPHAFRHMLARNAAKT